jgi:hypothetical protein
MSSGTIGSRDRGSGSDLERDFNFTPLGTFVVMRMTMGYTLTATAIAISVLWFRQITRRQDALVPAVA